MKLKKEGNIDRIIFLRLFTLEILKNIHINLEREKHIEKERIKQRISKIIYPEQRKENSKNINMFIKNNYPEKTTSGNISIMEKYQDKSKLKKIKLNEPPPKIEVKNIRSIGNEDNYIPTEENDIKRKEKQGYNKSMINKKTGIKYANQGMVDMNGMNKINDLFRDKTILSIECTGPGKHLLIKRYNQINIVKITLSQEEINGVIDYFSRKARIPVVDGILKVAVEDMIISSVASDLIGSKFIINKNSPYNIIRK